MSAPVDTPVTMSNIGRRPVSLHPQSNPAPKLRALLHRRVKELKTRALHLMPVNEPLDRAIPRAERQPRFEHPVLPAVRQFVVPTRCTASSVGYRRSRQTQRQQRTAGFGAEQI